MPSRCLLPPQEAERPQRSFWNPWVSTITTGAPTSHTRAHTCPGCILTALLTNSHARLRTPSHSPCLTSEQDSFFRALGAEDPAETTEPTSGFPRALYCINRQIEAEKDTPASSNHI